MSEAPDTGAETPQSAAARLFDLRVLIGGLFALYGIMLTVAGFFTCPEELAKASNININLWMSIGMLVIGTLFLAWWRLSPLRRDQPPAATGLRSHWHHQQHGLGARGQPERHETPDPVRSDAVKTRIQCVRQQADLHDQLKLSGIVLERHERAIHVVSRGADGISAPGGTAVATAVQVRE